MEIKAIDVSSNQGKPDWAKVSNAGIKVAMLRIHERHGQDSSFEHNYKGCKSNGILIGGYKYSYALTPAQAIEEAENVIEVLNGRGLDFPVFYDLEWDQQRSLGKQAVENITVSFLTRMKKAGYKVGVYCNYDWYKNCLSDALKQYDCWIARYPANDNGTVQTRLKPPVGVGWQYSSKGKVSGISGNVDMDVFYTDYRTEQKGETTVVKTKLQEFTELGDYYASNGGYLEKKSNAYLDDFKKNAGYNNYTKFARDVNSWGQPGCQAQPWCAEYQFWKLVKILGITKALKIMGGGFYNCVSITNHAKSNGTWRSSPKVGALVIFRNGSHVGSVRSFNSNTVFTNEGNTSSAAGVVANGGAVRNKSYAINDPAIDGYVWIDWGTDKPATSTWKATGTATSTVDDLYVRETPNGYVLGKLNKGDRVEINGEKSGMWTKVKVAGIGIAWVATKYIQIDGVQNTTATVITNKQDKTQRLYTGQVTASSLNVRTWGGAEYPNIKKYPTLSKGDKVDVMNFTQKAKDGSSWYYIRIAGKYFGFVSAKYIRKV